MRRSGGICYADKEQEDQPYSLHMGIVTVVCLYAGLHLRARTYAIWRSVGVCSPHGSTSLKAVSYGWGDGGDFPFCGCNDQAFEKNLNLLDFFYIFAYNISEKRDLLGGSPG